jgi:hypothetical protein
LGYGHEKPNKNLVSMLIHGDLTFSIELEKGSKDEEKND